MLQLSPHQHSAKLLPHHHTSYRALAILLALAGIIVLLATLAIVRPGNADSGNITVSGTVPGTPPTAAPVITVPTNGSQVTTQTITVSGSCSPSLTVVVTDNQLGRGSTICDQQGTFSLTISLIAATNVLQAYHLDNLNQNGPLSSPVTVTYAAPASLPQPQAVTAPPKGSAVAQSVPRSSGSPPPFSIIAPYRFDTVQANTAFTLYIDLENGSPPYAIQIDWGDHTQQLLSRAAAGQFTFAHTYSKNGRFAIKLNASDAAGHITYFQTTVTVGGAVANPVPAPTVPEPVVPAYELMIIWPLFLVGSLVAFSFWLGERYNRHYWHPPPPA